MSPRQWIRIAPSSVTSRRSGGPGSAARTAPSDNAFGIHRACLARYLVTVHEHHQCWNRADRKAGGEGRLFFRIHFGQAKRGLELPGCTGERGRHASTGAAPGRPEVDDDREFGAADMLVEGRRRQDGRRTVKKRRLAMTTAPLVTQTRFRHPVWTMATRADNYSRCIHDDKRRLRDRLRSRCGHWRSIQAFLRCPDSRHLSRCPPPGGSLQTAAPATWRDRGIACACRPPK